MQSSQFQNTVIKFGLPIDDNQENQLKQVRGYNYSFVTPTELENVRIGAISKPCMKWIGMDQGQADPETLSGNKLMEGSKPMAHCYCGHQFGVFAGQLGDGRAISLGDIKSKTDQIVDLQIKGGGLTPYSRRADGRAVLRSSIREFLCSEAMWALGIPTSRAASLVVSDTTVARDKLYTGNVRQEPCAVVLRVAPTFMRFGSFEIFKPKDKYSGSQGPSYGLKEQMLPNMLDYLLEFFYKEINESTTDKEMKYKFMFEKIVKDTADLVALWQCYGFCHGVLNTDNMSIMGLTIDYGPFAWMEHHNPDFICNHSDNDRGRYRYKSQPEICKWNLFKLCESFDPILDLEYTAEYVRDNFDQFYQAAYNLKMGQKLGFLITKPNKECDGFSGTQKQLVDPEHQEFRDLNQNEIDCIKSLFETMEKTGSDFTDTFRILGKYTKSNQDQILKQFVDICAPQKLLEKKKHSKYSPAELVKIEQILEKQPEILMFYGIDIEDAKAAVKEWRDSQKEVKKENTEDITSKNNELWNKWLIEYSQNLTENDSLRHESMNRMNPSFILRNYLMEEAISLAEEKNDFSKVDSLLSQCLSPFSGSQAATAHPDWRFDICISCSS